MFFKTWRLTQVALLLSIVNFVFVSCNSTPANTNKEDSSSLVKANATTVTPTANDQNAKKDIALVANNDVYDSTKQYIYLTFDDGPQPGTMACFRTIEQLGVKASFFMVGLHRWDAYRKAVVDSIDDSYPMILLANHSFTH